MMVQWDTIGSEKTSKMKSSVDHDAIEWMKLQFPIWWHRLEFPLSRFVYLDVCAREEGQKHHGKMMQSEELDNWSSDGYSSHSEVEKLTHSLTLYFTSFRSCWQSDAIKRCNKFNYAAMLQIVLHWSIYAQWQQWLIRKLISLVVVICRHLS